MGSMINFFKSGNLGLAMYGNCGSGRGARAIMAMCDEWWVVVFGGGVSINNEPANKTPRKETEKGSYLLCLHGGARKINFSYNRRKALQLKRTTLWWKASNS